MTTPRPQDEQGYKPLSDATVVSVTGHVRFPTGRGASKEALDGRNSIILALAKLHSRAARMYVIQLFFSSALFAER